MSSSNDFTGAPGPRSPLRTTLVALLVTSPGLAALLFLAHASLIHRPAVWTPSDILLLVSTLLYGLWLGADIREQRVREKELLYKSRVLELERELADYRWHRLANPGLYPERWPERAGVRVHEREQREHQRN